MAQGRYHQLDFLRSLACGMVLCFHYLYRGHLSGWVPFEAPKALWPVLKMGHMGVPLFFAISGFVIFLTTQNATPRQFVASRAARLYPAFWAAIVLTTIAVRMGPLPALQVPWPDVFINLTMLSHWFRVEFVDSAYWTLAVELHFYILVWILLRFGLMRHIKAVMTVWLALSLVYLLKPMYSLDFVLCVRWAPFFSMGICAFLMQRGDRGGAVHALFGAAAVLGAMLSWAHLSKLSWASPSDMLAAAALSLCISAVFWLISRDRFHFRGSSLLYWAATLTYPFYLLHEYIGYVALFTLWRAGVPAAACVGLVVSGVLLLSYLVHRWIEKPLAAVIKRTVAGGLAGRTVVRG